MKVRKILLLMTTILLLFSLSACKSSDTETAASTVETREEVDEYGNTYTATYIYVDGTKDRGLDASSIKAIVLASLVLLALSAYFWYRILELKRIEDRCTASVNAMVTEVRKSKHGDRYLRTRYMQYNATYRYTYNGMEYVSQNEYYGGNEKGVFFAKPDVAVGDMVEIRIDPLNPRTLIDIYAKSFKNRLFKHAMILDIGAVVMVGMCIFM